MKQAIVFHSKTGFTQRYAQLLSQQTGAPLLPLEKAAQSSLAGYDRVVFGSFLHAGRISGLKKFLRLAQDKPLLLFVTGAAPTQADFWQANLSGEQLARIPHFYFPGGLCYEKMPLPDLAMMKLAAFFMSRQPGADPQFAAAIRHSYDLFDPAAIAPLAAEMAALK